MSVELKSLTLIENLESMLDIAILGSVLALIIGVIVGCIVLALLIYFEPEWKPSRNSFTVTHYLYAVVWSRRAMKNNRATVHSAKRKGL